MHFKSQTLTFESPIIMGIINVTPDSMSDGGVHLNPTDAIASAERMIEEGAKIIDIGGESTRPFSNARPSLQEELDRIMPVLEGVKDFSTIISIDTSKPDVMREAIKHGAHIWNDVRGLRNEGSIELLAESDIGVCIMHMQGEPDNMQDNPEYGDVIADIKQYLSDKVDKCLAAGISRDRICLDPGIGFGKTTEHCLDLLKGVQSFKSLGLPVLIGASRKTFLGKITDRDPTDRFGPSIASAIIAAMNGADIIRVHDVKETVDALKILEAYNGR